MHPQDELSRIKMRNRRFVNACVQENSLYNANLFGGPAGPFVRGVPVGAPMAPSATLDFEMAQDELAVSSFLTSFLNAFLSSFLSS
jgi:hypothetical protein